jgi:Domain of unknown function (DUF4160)
VPTVHRFGPYRFYFYSQENRASFEAPHIHVASSDRRAVFWLEPVSLRTNWGYTPREIERLRRIVMANRELLLRSWNEFFNHPSG